MINISDTYLLPATQHQLVKGAQMALRAQQPPSQLSQRLLRKQPAAPSAVRCVLASLKRDQGRVPRTAPAFPGATPETMAMAADVLALGNIYIVLGAGDAMTPSPLPLLSPDDTTSDSIVYVVAQDEAANVLACLKRLVAPPPLDGQIEAGPSADSPTSVFSSGLQGPTEVLFYWPAGLGVIKELQLSSFPLGVTYDTIWERCSAILTALTRCNFTRSLLWHVL